MHFGLYASKTEALRKVYFSQVKLADNFSEALPAALISPTPHMKTIVAESFGGAGVALHGTTADTFASAITSAGGSSKWIAHTNFLNNGAVLTNPAAGRCAGLNLGSYIDDAKNTFAGYFELTMTISPTVGPGWLSLGFAQENTINTNKNFNDSPAGSPTETGNATIIYRGSTATTPYELDMYGGPKTSNSIDGPTVSGSQTLTVALDLTPVDGYNGVNKFGRVIWKTNGVAMGSFTYTNDRSWGSLLVSQGSGNTGTISALTLAQSRMDIAVKANNTNDLDETTSWVLGNSPDNTTKIAYWDDTVTSANTVSLGTNTTWGGINILNPSGKVTIKAGNTLTLGNEPVDIDMSQAAADLALNCGVVLGAANVWNVGNSRTLTAGGVVSGSRSLTKTGPGTLTLNATNTYTGNTTVSQGRLKVMVPSLATNSTISVAAGAVLELGFTKTNLVAAFITNGVALPAGIYSSNNTAPFLAGPGSLKVGPTVLTLLNPTNFSDTATYTNSKTYTLAYDPDNTTDALVVILTTETLAPTVSVTWGGVPLTQVYPLTGNDPVGVYYLNHPANVGLANLSVTVTRNPSGGNINGVGFAVMALSNVGNFPITPTAYLVQTGTAATNNIPLVVPGDASFVVAGFSSGDSSGGVNITATPNLTLLDKDDFGSVQGFFGYDADVAAGTNNYKFTTTNTPTFATAVAFAAVSTPTFASWISNPAFGLAPANQDPGDDPDGDRIPNAVENFFGTNPSVPSGGLVAGAVSGNTFTFTHPQNATPAGDLTADYQWSKALTGFLPDGAADGAGTTVTFTTQPNTPSPGFTRVTATVTGTLAGKLFVRVNVTQP